jgi:hypothetical protein
MLGPPMLGPPGLSIKSSDKTTQMCGYTFNEPTTGAAIRFAGDLWLEVRTPFPPRADHIGGGSLRPLKR